MARMSHRSGQHDAGAMGGLACPLVEGDDGCARSTGAHHHYRLRADEGAGFRLDAVSGAVPEAIQPDHALRSIYDLASAAEVPPPALRRNF